MSKRKIRDIQVISYSIVKLDEKDNETWVVVRLTSKADKIIGAEIVEKGNIKEMDRWEVFDHLINTLEAEIGVIQ